jgi:LPXTG-site transpeptidase (sortase) family protein
MRTNRYDEEDSVFHSGQTGPTLGLVNRMVAAALSVAPVVLVAIAAAVILTSAPASAPAAYVGPVLLPETRGISTPAETPHVLKVDGLRVVVPRLAIDLPLEIGDLARDVPRPGFSGDTPEQVALVYPGSRTPGDGGNTYIYAHARTGMFLSLWSAKAGDVVVIARADGSVVASYQVALIVPRVDPADTHWLETRGDERLTLQTSTGPRPEDPRFIVVAYRVSGPVDVPGLP